MSVLLQSLTKSLPVKLSTGSLIAKGKELTDLLQKRTSMEVTHKNRRDQMKEEISNIESQIGSIAGIVSRGEEYRDIVCDVFIGDNDIVIIKRTDTGEPIETRPARDDERQIALGLFPENSADESQVTPEGQIDLSSFEIREGREGEKSTFKLNNKIIRSRNKVKGIIKIFSENGIVSKSAGELQAIIADYPPSEKRNLIMRTLEGVES